MPLHFVPQDPNFCFNLDFRIGPADIWSRHDHVVYEVCYFADEFVQGFDA
jgi:hypothetical protein